MTRRDLLHALTIVLTTLGIFHAPKLSAVETTATPALFVIEVTDVLDSDQIKSVTTALKSIVRGTPFADARCVVLNGGARLSVYDRSGVLLNVPLSGD